MCIRDRDIGLGTVFVADQRDVCCSVRIVLDTDYGCRDAILVSLEMCIRDSSSSALISFSRVDADTKVLPTVSSII